MAASDDSSNSTRCFNCHLNITQSKVEPDPNQPDADEGLSAYIVDSRGNVISSVQERPPQQEKGSSTEPSLLDRLVYVFELQRSAIEDLNNADVNDQRLCNSCNALLISLYLTRRAFLQATSQQSCLARVLIDNRTEDAIPKRKRRRLVHGSSSDGHFEDDGPGENLYESDPDWSPGLSPPPPSTSRPRQGKGASPEIKQAVVKLVRLPEEKPESQPKKRRSSSHTKVKKKVLRNMRLKIRKEKRKAEKICQKCGKSLASFTSLKKHLKTNACDSNKSRAPAADRPEISVSTCYTFTCPICGNPNLKTGRGRLEQHLRSHMNAEERAQELICCGVNRKTLTELELHRKDPACTAVKLVAPLNRPTAKKVQQCPECGKTIKSVVPSALKHHMDLVHARVSKFVCEICGRPCPNQRALRDHNETHYNREERKAMNADRARDHLCQICGKAFLKNYQLRLHAKKVHVLSEQELSEMTYFIDMEGTLHPKLPMHEERSTDTAIVVENVTYPPPRVDATIIIGGTWT